MDRWCGAHTIDAIIAFQHKAGFRHTDGLIEPHGPTWRALTDPGDGNITISEISATVYRQYRLGMEKGNFG